MGIAPSSSVRLTFSESDLRSDFPSVSTSLVTSNRNCSTPRRASCFASETRSDAELTELASSDVCWTAVETDVHAAGRFAGAVACGLCGTRDFLVCGSLFLDCTRNRTCQVPDLGHLGRQCADRACRVLDGGLNTGDPARNLVGRLGCLFRKFLDLRRDNRKAAPGFPRTGRLDRGIERKQVGLFGDVTDQVDNAADMFRSFRKCLDILVAQPLQPPRFR